VFSICRSSYRGSPGEPERQVPPPFSPVVPTACIAARISLKIGISRPKLLARRNRVRYF